MPRALRSASAQVRESSTGAGEVLNRSALGIVINNKKRFLGLAVKNLAKLHNLQGRSFDSLTGRF